MKSIKINGLLLFTILSISLSSCLKDVGNKTSSYGIGTVFSDGMRQYIQLDPEWGYLKVTSQDISLLNLKSEDRVFVSYSIDFDNQPAGLSPNLYWATLDVGTADVVRVDVTNYPTGLDYLTKADTLLQVSSPYVTSFSDPNGNDDHVYLTFQTKLLANKKGGNEYEMYFYRKGRYVVGSKKDTLYVDYRKGDVEAPKSLVPFFTVPINDYQGDDNVELIVRFKAQEPLFPYETEKVEMADGKKVDQKFFRCKIKKNEK